jgi:hypothetical protein
MNFFVMNLWVCVYWLINILVASTWYLCAGVCVNLPALVLCVRDVQFQDDYNKQVHDILNKTFQKLQTTP